MRFLMVVILVLGCSSSVFAQQQQQGDAGTSHNFGRANCPQPVPCPNGGGAPMSAAALASTASSCITQYFGYSNANGFFDTGAGTDYNGCLTAVPNVLPKGMGSQLTPACCIVQQPSGVCTFRCELNAGP